MTAKGDFNKGYYVTNGRGQSNTNMEIDYEWVKDPKTLTRIQSWGGYDVIQIIQEYDFGDEKFHRVVATIVGKKGNDMCIFTGKSVENYEYKSCFPIGGTVH
jgi:hypothetical protein